MFGRFVRTSRTQRSPVRNDHAAMGDSDLPEQSALFHFSVATERGPGQDDVASLLRRVADVLDQLGAGNVHDITFHVDWTDDGSWPSMTVYYEVDDEEFDDEVDDEVGAASGDSYDDAVDDENDSDGDQRDDAPGDVVDGGRDSAPESDDEQRDTWTPNV